MLKPMQPEKAETLMLAGPAEQLELDGMPAAATRGRVYQHNVLAEARYRLSLRAQRLLVKLISELDTMEDAFVEVRLTLDDFAPLAAKERNDVTFAHFTEAARQLLGRFVVIELPRREGEKENRVLNCHWISSGVEDPNDKSITFSFDPKLTPFLLGLKQDYFSYPMMMVCSCDSTYSIRLYQFLKARAFYAKPQVVSVPELRYALGTVEYDASGRVTRESLVRYADFKRVALDPGLQELNAKTDLGASYREIKRPGTKIVEKLVFTISSKKEAGNKPNVVSLPSVPESQQLVVGGVGVTAGSVAEEFGLNAEQARQVNQYIRQKGTQYVAEKVELTQSKDRENAAAYFLSALRNDYRKPVKISPKRPKVVRPAPVLEVLPEVGAEEREHNLGLLAQARLKIRG